MQTTTAAESVLLSNPDYIRQKEYWQQRMSGDINTTNLLISPKVKYNCPAKFASQKIEIPGQDCGKLFELANHSDILIHIILLTALQSLVYRYTGNQAPIILTPVYHSTTISAE